MKENILDKTHGFTGAVKFIFKNVKTGEEDVIHILNVFVHAGKSGLARRLANQEAEYGRITYMAVGTGAGVPASSDVAMFTELFRKAISVTSVNSNVVTFTTFFATAEANGTLTEAGLWGDLATSTAGSGTLYAHTAVARTKTSNDTLTVEWVITIN